MQKPPVCWFEFTDSDGKKWKVFGSSHEDSDKLRGDPGTPGYFGMMIPDERMVLIDATSAKRTQDYIVLHEIMHAALSSISDLPDEAEERVITELAPRLYPILKRLGLKWPNRPDLLASFRRHSRRHR